MGALVRNLKKRPNLLRLTWVSVESDLRGELLEAEDLQIVDMVAAKTSPHLIEGQVRPPWSRTGRGPAQDLDQKLEGREPATF